MTYFMAQFVLYKVNILDVKCNCY